jgi:hypothetical protein
MADEEWEDINIGQPSMALSSDDEWEDIGAVQAPIAPASTDWRNEILSVGNAGARGAASVVDLADKISRNLGPFQAGGPRLFGLNENEFNTPKVSAYDSTLGALESLYLYGPETAQTEGGQLASDVTENLVMGAPFGPGAAVASGILGGGGQYGGRAIAEEFGGADGLVDAEAPFDL